jgi:hypothetical protein
MSCRQCLRSATGSCRWNRTPDPVTVTEPTAPTMQSRNLQTRLFASRTTSEVCDRDEDAGIQISTASKSACSVPVRMCAWTIGTQCSPSTRRCAVPISRNPESRACKRMQVGTLSHIARFKRGALIFTALPTRCTQDSCAVATYLCCCNEIKVDILGSGAQHPAARDSRRFGGERCAQAGRQTWRQAVYGGAPDEP